MSTVKNLEGHLPIGSSNVLSQTSAQGIGWGAQRSSVCEHPPTSHHDTSPIISSSISWRQEMKDGSLKQLKFHEGVCLVIWWQIRCHAWPLTSRATTRRLGSESNRKSFRFVSLACACSLSGGLMELVPPNRDRPFPFSILPRRTFPFSCVTA